MNGAKDPGICPGHEELRTIVIQTQIEVKHLAEAITRTLEKMEELDENVRDLQIHGAKISQDNAENLKELTKRVKFVEDFVEGHKAATAESAKIAAGVATVISLVIALGGLLVAMFWGKP